MLISFGSSLTNIWQTIGISTEKVPQLVPVENEVAQAMRNITKGKLERLILLIAINSEI